MENNNNLLSFGLRCGDSVTFSFVLQRYMEIEAKMGEQAGKHMLRTRIVLLNHIVRLYKHGFQLIERT